MNSKLKILWLDTETTGLNKENGIHQLGGIIEDFPISKQNNLTTFDIRANCIDAGCKVSEWYDKKLQRKVTALSVSHTTEEQVKSYQPYQDAYKELINIFKQHIDPYDKESKFILAGYNINFDKDRLTDMANVCNDKYLFAYIDHRVIDVQTLARTAYALNLFQIEPKSFKLEDLAPHFGIAIDAHDALEDIQATRKLFFVLIDLIQSSNSISSSN